MGTINKHKNNGKEALQSRKKIIKEMRDKYNIE